MKTIILLSLAGLLALSHTACNNQAGTDAADIQENNKAIDAASVPVPDVESSKQDEQYFFNEPDAHPSNTYIKIFKESRILELYGDDILLGRFRIALGRSSEGDKNKEGDSKTPEGSYYICTRNASSRFTLFLGISYPNTEDADRGLENNIITHEEYEAVKRAEESKQCPPWNTPMGGEVGIHGGGNSHDWTLGCIALSDEDIHIIWKYSPLKTPVEIFK